MVYALNLHVSVERTPVFGEDGAEISNGRGDDNHRSIIKIF
jgi:hypothetical protein